MDAAEIGIVLLVAAEAPQAYSAFLPSIMTIRTFVDDQDAVNDIREGELLGSAFVLLIAGAGALLAKSPWPFVVGIVTIVTMIAVYEYALSGRRGLIDMTTGGLRNDTATGDYPRSGNV